MQAFFVSANPSPTGSYIVLKSNVFAEIPCKFVLPLATE